jgi:GTP pyrophosphokinase
LSREEQPGVVVSGVPTEERVSSNVQVLGVGDLLTRTARCCNPVPGDEIIGYITRSRGVSIHRKDCSNIAHIFESDRERLVPVDWGKISQLYPVDVRIEAWDRVGLIRDISAVAAEEGVNITSMSTTEHEDQTISILATLETRGVGQLSRLLSKMEGVRGVNNVMRCVEGVRVKEGLS